MNKYVKKAILMLALATAGCTTMSLEELKRTEPQGTPFQKALAQRYMDFAISEADQYDWLDSMYFADKGLLAAYGKDTAPEAPEGWRIPLHARVAITEAHARLVAALVPESIESMPEAAADAQFYFDCWVEQQEENWQEDDIAQCREGFSEALERIEGRAVSPEAEAQMRREAEKEMAASAPEVGKEEPAPAGIEPPAAAAMEDVAYVVFFEDRKIEISAAGNRVIDEVIGLLKPRERYEVILNSHTDTVGEARSNQELSQKRAEIVKKRLVAGGVEEKAIRIFAFGESDPHVKTADQVHEPANQRVEIFLND